MPTWERKMVEDHNELRALHGKPPLVGTNALFGFKRYV